MRKLKICLLACQVSQQLSAKQRSLLLRAHSLFGETPVIPRALSRAVHLYFRGSPADSSNPSWCPDTQGPILQDNVSPAAAPRERSARHRTRGLARGLAQHGPIPPLVGGAGLRGRRLSSGSRAEMLCTGWKLMSLCAFPRRKAERESAAYKGCR